MLECGKYRYRIEPREVDFTRRATIVAIGDHILHAAGEDADKNGFGIRDLNHDNTSWVLSRIAVEMERFPQQYEQFEIETWVEEINRLMTTRNFILKDHQENVIGKASTYWSKIDLTTRLPLDLRSDPQYASYVNPIPSPIKKPAKIVVNNSVLVSRRKVVYSDIDFNQHANSMKYIQWMLDELPLEYFSGLKFKRLDINFVHEAKYSDNVDIFIDRADDLHVVQFEVKRDDGVALCRATLTAEG